MASAQTVDAGGRNWVHASMTLSVTCMMPALSATCCKTADAAARPKQHSLWRCALDWQSSVLVVQAVAAELHSAVRTAEQNALSRAWASR